MFFQRGYVLYVIQRKRVRYVLEHGADIQITRKRTETYVVNMAFDRGVDKIIKVSTPGNLEYSRSLLYDIEVVSGDFR